MFDPNPLNNVPDQIKDMYSKAFEAASSGMSDAFKDLPKHMQDALDGAGIKDMLSNWDDLSDKVKDAKKQLDEKAKTMKRIIDMAEHLNELLRDQAQIEIDMAEEERDKASTLQDFLRKQENVERTTTRWNGKLQKSAGLINAMKSSYMGVTTAHGALNQQQNTFTKGQAASTLLANAFGKKWTGLVGTFRALTGGGLAMFAALGKGIGMVTAQLGEAYQISRNMGYGVGQSINNIGTGITDFLNNLRQGTLTSVKTQVELRNLFSREFGNRDAPSQVQNAASDMVAYYRLSAQEASKLSAALYRNNRFNAQAVLKDYNMLQNTAKANGVGPAEIMKDMAQNAGIFATYADRGTAAFVRSAIEVRKLGLSLQSVAGFADRMVNDFESSLMMQAKIQTIMPGADFSEVQYASQYGTEGDVAAALKGALGGRNIMSLPRSLRNMISQSTGLGMEELRNLDRGNDPNNKGFVQGGDQEERGKLEKFVGSIDASISQINLFSAALVVATARLGTSFIGSSMGGVAGKGIAAATRIGAAAPVVGGVISGGMSAYGQYGESKAAGRTTGQASVDAGIRGVGAGGGAIGGALGGAAMGAALGSVVPLIGTAIGGIAGGIIGGLGGGFLGDYAGKAAVNKLRSTEVKHSGGIVGQGFRRRTVDSSVFEGAPRFHKGLMPDEVPSILQRGEAVLSRTQLSGLTNLMQSVQSLGKIGDKVGNLKLDGLTNFGEGISSLAKTFSGGKLGNFSQMASSLTGSGASGGIGGMISGLFGGKAGGIVSGITNMFSSKSSGVGGMVSGLLGGKAGGIVSGITSLFGGKKKTDSAGGGIGGMVSGLLGGKTGGVVSNLTSGGGIKGASSNLLTKVPGVGGLLGGGAKNIGANLASKIPGVGGLASSLIKGGGIKGIGGSLLKAGAGKAIGGAIGTLIPIPGVGTLLGSALGGLASKGIGKLANSKIGKSVMNVGGKVLGGIGRGYKKIGGAALNAVSKVPVLGSLAKAYTGVAGKAVGGIKRLFGFGRRKKAEVASPRQATIDPDMSALNQSAGEYTGSSMYGTPSDGGPGAQSVVKVDNANLENLLTQLLAATKEGKDVYLDGKKVGNSLVNAYSRDT